MKTSQCSNRYQVRELVDADLKQVLVKDHSRAPVSVSNLLQKDASRLCRKQSSVQSFLVQSWIFPTGKVKELAGKTIVIAEYALDE
ncbi:TPA: hypothetical protein U1C77_001981 [Streptococcus suis]|nr:hypothetical protein [Streptococcus suis]HEM3666256.1 hypothetical protein [Streptococcus suis]